MQHAQRPIQHFHHADHRHEIFEASPTTHRFAKDTFALHNRVADGAEPYVVGGILEMAKGMQAVVHNTYLGK
jgi:hypothetical protein